MSGVSDFDSVARLPAPGDNVAIATRRLGAGTPGMKKTGRRRVPKPEGKPTKKSEQLWVHNEVDFAAIANQIGAVGIRVTEPAQIVPALDEALAAKRPAVIDVVTDIDAAAPLAWDSEAWVQRY